MMNCAMVIEILNDTILHGLHMTSTREHTLQYNSNHNVKNISFKYIISKYKLDFKQSVAFEIMSYSFIINTLKNLNLTDDVLQQFSQENKNNQDNYTGCLKRFKKSLKDKGGEEHLIMFLSGMGGTEKSEAIKSFVDFIDSISIFFDWDYHSDVMKVLA